MNLVVLLLGLAVVSEEVMTEAKRLYEAGGQAYEQGRYPIAIDAFEAAFKMAPRAATAFSGAQAYRLQYFIDGDRHHLERAVDLYRAYLELAPDGNRREHAAQHLSTLVPILDRVRREVAAAGATAESQPPARASVRTQVIVACRTPGATVRIDGGEAEPAPAAFAVAPGRHRIDVDAAEHVAQTLDTVAVEGTVVALSVELAPRPGLIAVRTEPGVQVTVDGQLAGTSPMSHPIEVRPGHHAVALTARGRRPFVREVEVGRGQKLDVDARLERTTQRWFSYGLLGGGGALLVGTAVTLGMALDRQRQAGVLEARLDAHVAWTTEEAARYRALEGERDDLVRIGTATGVVGLAAAALGLVLWVVDNPEAPTAVVAPVVGPGLGGVAVSGWF